MNYSRWRVLATVFVVLISACATSIAPIFSISELPQGSLVLDTTTLGRTASGAYGWVTAPTDFLRGAQLDVVGASGSAYSYNRAFPYPHVATNPIIDWTRPAITAEQLSGGVKRSSDQVLKPGSSSLEWNHHPQFPTMMSELVGTPDWSGYGGMYISVYSAQATNEIITLGVLNDSAATPYLDYWTIDITVNWTGWKQTILPFDGFSSIGSPRDRKSVSGIYFFSKAQRRSPNPATDLYFGQLALVQAASTSPAPPVTPPDWQLTFGSDPVFYVQRNHTQPEISSNLTSGTGNAVGTRVSQLPFFAGVRSQYNYNPRFDPGFVSLDPEGRVFVRSQEGGGLKIEWLNGNQWQVTDLMPTIKARVGAGSTLVGTSEPMIRFDKDGDAYLIVDYQKNGGAGTLLLHTKDIINPNWQVYALTRPGPNYFRGILADFEKLDTYNQAALNHPPVITLTTHTYATGTNQAAYLLIPSKNSDGTLTIPAPLEYTPYGLIGPVHSGGGNFVISKGDMIYLVYGYMAPPGANNVINPSDARYLAKKPPIASSNPANALTWTSGSTVLQSANGIPTFVRSYNRVTKVLSEPNFVGYAGFAMDAHDWAAMTLDAIGNLQVILNGHNQAMGYTHTITPGDISKWTPESFVHLTEPNGADVIAAGSYCGISVDKNNQIVVVDRSDTNYYNHRIGVFTKPVGAEKWNAEHSVVVPFGDNYHVWNQRASYDPSHHRYFLGYFDQGGQTVLSHDAYLFHRFFYPDFEKPLTGGTPGSGQNEGLPPPTGGETRIFSTVATEFTLLVSDDAGANWRIATTPDFVSP
jgi:hypothetical protein